MLVGGGRSRARIQNGADEAFSIQCIHSWKLVDPLMKNAFVYRLRYRRLRSATTCSLARLLPISYFHSITIHTRLSDTNYDR